MTRSPVALIASLLSIVAVPVLLAAATVLPNDSQEPASVRVARGKVAFRIYCRSCHGAEARGDGPLAQELKSKPADLTHLVAKDGSFPRDQVAGKIDGRLSVGAHGPTDMPVWGLSFQVSGSDSAQDLEVQRKIDDLVAYLETLQAK